VLEVARHVERQVARGVRQPGRRLPHGFVVRKETELPLEAPELPDEEGREIAADVDQGLPSWSWMSPRLMVPPAFLYEPAMRLS